MDSQLTMLTTMYSTYAELSATQVCFMLNSVINTDLKLKQHPKVLFLSIALISQYEFEYPYNFISPSPTYLKP